MKKNKIPSNKLNQRDERAVLRRNLKMIQRNGKISHILRLAVLRRNLKMIQRNGKISHILRLEELILLKYQYPKQYTDLMESLSKCP